MSSLTLLATLGDHIIDLAFDDCGRHLLAAEIGGPIWLFQDEQKLGVRAGHSQGTTSLAWQPGASRWASCGQDGQLALWSVESEQPLRVQAPDPWCNRVAWHRKGKWLAVVGGRHLAIHDAQGERQMLSEPHCSSLVDVAWMPHQETCVTAGYQGLQAWSPSSSSPKVRYQWQGSTLRLAISPNQRFIATGDQDRTVHFWRTKKPQADESAMMSGFATKVECLSWDRDGRYLATGGSSDVCLWDCLEPGPEDRDPKILKGDPEGLVTAVAFAPKRDWLASGNERGEICLWDHRKSSQPLGRWLAASAVSGLAWRADGQSLAVGCSEGEVYLLQINPRASIP